MLLINETDVIRSITKYLKTHDYKDKDIIDLYNCWATDSQIILKDNRLVDIALSFLNDAKELDLDMLYEADEIDQLMF